MAKPAQKKPAAKKTIGASRNRRGSARSGVPAWVWLILGLAVGLFAAFLWHLSELKKINASAPAGEPTEVRAAENNQASKKSHDKTAEKEPHFDFYTLLPNQKVMSQARTTSAAPPTPEAAPAISTAAATPATTPSTTEKNSSAEKNNEKNTRTAFLLQAGSFKKETEADKRRAAILLIGLPVRVQKSSAADSPWYRVIVGPVIGEAAAKNARAQLQNSGIDSVIKKH